MIKKIDINMLTSLIYILDDYESFQKELLKFINSKDNRNDIFKLIKIVEGQKVFNSSKARKFYQNNKRVIDTINKYYWVGSYINQNYDCFGNKYDNSAIDYFYQYLVENRNHINNILKLLNKLSYLGFSSLSLSLDEDFTRKIYTLDKSIENNYSITYLENIRILPNVENDIIKYKSEQSNYKIVFENTDLYLEYPQLLKSIVLNDLLIDVDKLPETVYIENVVSEIVNLEKVQGKDYRVAKESLKLNVGINKMLNQCNNLDNIINNLNDSTSKEELKQTLKRINAEIVNMYLISDKYDIESTKDNPLFTTEMLKDEKKLLIKKYVNSYNDGIK